MLQDPRDLGCLCDACPYKGSRPVFPSLLGPIAVCAEEPGPTELVLGAPLVGASGQLLLRALQKYGLDRQDLTLTNATLCCPATKPKRHDKQIALECCRPRLVQELKGFKVVQALGEHALHTLTDCRGGISSWVGYPVPGRDGLEHVQIMPNFHPAYALRVPAYIPVFRRFLARGLQMHTEVWKPGKFAKVVITEGEEMLTVLRYFWKNRPLLGMDIETYGPTLHQTTLRCIGLVSARVGVSIPWPPKDPEILALTEKIVESPKVPKVLHNGQFDVLHLRAVTGLITQGYVHDTMLASNVVGPQIAHDLGFQAALWLRLPRWKTQFRASGDEKTGRRFEEAPGEELREYNGRDSSATKALLKPLKKALVRTHKGPELYAEYLRLNTIACDMAWHGMTVDKTALEKHRISLSKLRTKTTENIQELCQALGLGTVNPRSPVRIGQLFNNLGVQAVKWSKQTGAPSWDEEALQKLVPNPRQEVSLLAQELLRFRRWDKLLCSYVEGLPVDIDGRIHPAWKTHGTITGRWSCSPSLQCIPKPRTEKNDKGEEVIVAPGLRDLFIPHAPQQFIVCADYSQLELRLISLVSMDKPLIDAYAAGADVHSINTTKLFHTDKWSADQRNLAKRFVFGANYGAEPITLWRNLVVDFPTLKVEDVARLCKQWFTDHPDIVAWQERTFRTAKKEGYVEAPFSGRREHFHDARAERNKCFNFPIQSTGADLMNAAIVEVAKEVDWKNTHILAQCHDELVLCTDDVPRAAALLTRCMTKTLEYGGYSMTFPIELKVGPNWGTVQKYKL